MAAIIRHSAHKTMLRTIVRRRQAEDALRLPQELAFPPDVKEVHVSRQGDAILLSPLRADWTSFFKLDTVVPDDFIIERGDSSPQSREPL
ncbi:MAG: type II toxin-antitoxin system VapB family antitoxin [Steroidobacteraceae bacterium]